MRLAKDRYGRVGRQIRSMGIEAVVEPAMQGVRRGNVNISVRSIEEDQAYYNKKDREQAALHQAKKVQAFAARKANEVQSQIQRQEILRQQRPAMNGKQRALNRKLRKHFGLLGSTPESERVAHSVKADFHMNEQLPGDAYGRDPREINWRSDYRANLIVGNPLTRNGVFGPVTDYERFVDGDEMVNQRVYMPQQPGLVIAGGTMVGRYQGQDVPVPRQGTLQGMGDDEDYSYEEDFSSYADDPYAYDEDWPPADEESFFSSNEDVTSSEVSDPSFWERISSGAGDALKAQLPALQQAAIMALASGGKVTKSGSSIVISQPGKPAQTVTMPGAIPTWMKYSAFGILGVGVLLVGIKLMKRTA